MAEPKNSTRAVRLADIPGPLLSQNKCVAAKWDTDYFTTSPKGSMHWVPDESSREHATTYEARQFMQRTYVSSIAMLGDVIAMMASSGERENQAIKYVLMIRVLYLPFSPSRLSVVQPHTLKFDPLDWKLNLPSLRYRDPRTRLLHTHIFRHPRTKFACNRSDISYSPDTSSPSAPPTLPTSSSRNDRLSSQFVISAKTAMTSCDRLII
jgi:hypothetical protein